MPNIITSELVKTFMQTATAAAMRTVIGAATAAQGALADTALQPGGALGTPSSGVGTNLTGTAAGLTAGVASAVAVGGITGLGTGIAAALAINTGSAGAPVLFGGVGSFTTIAGTTGTLTGNLTFGTSASILNGATGSIGLTATGTNQSITWTPSGTGNVATASGNLLLSGVANGIGKLQFPADTTSAGGATMGVDIAIYRTGARSIAFDGTNGASMFIGLRQSGVTTASLQVSSASMLLTADSSVILRTAGGTNALALDASQDSLFTPANRVRIGTTKVLSFGATANATIGVSADTTAGVLTFTAPSAGSFNFTGGGVTARITQRVQSVANAATITPNADSDDFVDITAIAQAFTIANPSGTPTNAQPLVIRIKDNGTARGITWGSNYVAGGVALPSTTVLSKILTLGLIYNTANALNKWQLVSSAQEA